MTPSTLVREAPPKEAGAGVAAADVSVLVVNYNTAHLLAPMRDALLAANDGLGVELIVVDNASRDDSVEVLRRDFQSAKVIVNDANVGFGRANNQGLPLATGRYLLLLNTDAFTEPDTLRKTVAFMDANPECGILGVRLVGRDGLLQPCCRYFPTPWNQFLNRSGLARWFPSVKMVDDMNWDHATVRECDWVPGCYYLVRREVIEQVGLFDPRFFLYCEEVDHCRAAKSAGWKVIYFPDTTVIHIGGESAKSEGALTTAGRQISALQIESELLYFRKHFGLPGAATWVALSTFGDVLVIAKHLARGRPMRELAPTRRRLAHLWQLAFRTRLGRVPTR